MSGLRERCRRRVMYHVSAATHASIARHGLDHRRGRLAEADDGDYGDSPPANYLWPTLAAARTWEEGYCPNGRIYTVDVAGLPLRRDLYFEGLPDDDADLLAFVGPRGGRPQAFYSDRPIAADRLSLLGS
jgi:hypothetical protein